MRYAHLIAFGSSLIVLSGQLLAQNPVLYNTGMQTASTVTPPVSLPIGSVEGHFNIFPFSGRTYAYSGALPTGWAANPSTSRWLTTVSGATVDLPSSYYYIQTTFDLTGINLATVNIQLQWAAPCGSFFTVNWNTNTYKPSPCTNGMQFTTVAVPAAWLQQGNNLIQFRIPSPANGVSGLHVKVSAAVTVPLYSTGVDNNRVPLANGAVDPHWTLVWRPAAVSNETSPNNGVWLANSASANSRWISPERDPVKSYPPGTYTFTTGFAGTNFNSATQRAVVTGRWAADNSGVLKINGVTYAAAQTSGYTSFANFTLDDVPLNTSWNTIDFVVTNDPLSGSTNPDSPVGVRIENFTVSFVPRTGACTPTPNLTSTSGGLYPIGMTPAPAVPFCDPVFGSQVVRVSDSTFGHQIQALGQYGFNRDATKIGTLTNPGGNNRVYDFDAATMGVSNPRIVVPSINGTPVGSNSSDCLLWSGASDAAANKTILFAKGMKFYKADVTNDAATLIADLSSLAGDGALWRCTASRWQADGSVTISATIQRPITVLGQVYNGNLGYVAFRMLSMSPGNQATNWQVRAKFINGIDSANLLTFESITKLGSDNITHVIQLATVYAAVGDGQLPVKVPLGYKNAIDKTGRYLLMSSNYASDPSPNNIAVEANTLIFLDLDRRALNDPFPYVFGQYAGHGDLSDGVYYGDNTAGYAPASTCILCRKKWTISSLTSDPAVCTMRPGHPLTCTASSPIVNSGTPITLPLSYWPQGDYMSAYSQLATEVGTLVGCRSDGTPGAERWGDCTIPSLPQFAGEIVSYKSDGTHATSNGATGFKRLAHTNHAGKSDYLQTIQSLDGRFVAFTSNFRYPEVITNQSPEYPTQVYVVRVPQ